MNLFKVFAGVPDFFKALRASSFKDVHSNAVKRLGTSDIKQRSADELNSLYDELRKQASNMPMDDDMWKAAVGYRRTVNDILEVPEYIMGGVGYAASMLGGTLGFGVKQATKGAVAGAALTGKGIKATADGAKALKEKIPKSDKHYDIQPQIFTEGFGTAMGAAIGKTGRWVGKGTAEVGAEMGRDIAATGKFLWKNRNSREMAYAVAAGTVILGGAAYETGVAEAKHNIKMQQIESNQTYDPTAGGTFLNRQPNNLVKSTSEVDDFGASGDLVFALHNLRNGG